jgi:hypothetical protein
MTENRRHPFRSRPLGDPLPKSGFPRWLEILGRLFDSGPRFLVYLVAAIAVVAGLSVVARADLSAGSIPERQAQAREVLGYAPGAPFQYEVGKFGYGSLEITVDSNVGLPDVASPTHTRSTSLRLAVASMNGPPANLNMLWREPTISQVYQVVGADWFTWYVSTYPVCVSPDQAAGFLAAPAGTYTCLTEEQLAEMTQAVIETTVWSKPDWHFVRKLQELHGASGLPVVTWASPIQGVLEDETATALPSVLRFAVFYQFVLPATPGWTPPEDPAVP